MMKGYRSRLWAKLSRKWKPFRSNHETSTSGRAMATVLEPKQLDNPEHQTTEVKRLQHPEIDQENPDMSRPEVSEGKNKDKGVPEQLPDETVEEMEISPKFTIFPQFPPEIRQKIWRLACCEPRVVEIHIYENEILKWVEDRRWETETSRKSYNLHSMTRCPPLLQTSRESRDIALSTYTTNNSRSGQLSLWKNFDFDTAYLGRQFLSYFKENPRRWGGSILRLWQPQEASSQNTPPREVLTLPLPTSRFPVFNPRNHRSVAVDAASMMHSTQGYLDRNKDIYRKMVGTLCHSLWECLKVLMDFENVEEIILVLNKDFCEKPDLSGTIHLMEMDLPDSTPMQILRQQAISVLEAHLEMLKEWYSKAGQPPVHPDSWYCNGSRAMPNIKIMCIPHRGCKEPDIPESRQWETLLDVPIPE
jgi:hypothetical protein